MLRNSYKFLGRPSQVESWGEVGGVSMICLEGDDYFDLLERPK